MCVRPHQDHPGICSVYVCAHIRIILAYVPYMCEPTSGSSWHMFPLCVRAHIRIILAHVLYMSVSTSGSSWHMFRTYVRAHIRIILAHVPYVCEPTSGSFWHMFQICAPTARFLTHVPDMHQDHLNKMFHICTRIILTHVSGSS
jgi:hypothetical protein